MKKRLAFVFVLVLCASLLCVGALAAGNSWADVADTTWYNETDTEFHISTAEQLAGLAKLVNDGNTFKGKTVYLDNNIDIADREWVSIGDGNNVADYWGGIFDGQGYAISGLYSHVSSNDYHGLFGVVSADGIVQNVSVINVDIYSFDSSLRMGIIADWVNTGTIKNCYTSGVVHNASGNKLLGGIVGTGTSSSKIIGCASDAEIISDYYDNGDAYSDCDTVGGIVGQWENSTDASLISNCWFGGSISCKFPDSGVGGILGANFDFSSPGVDIKNCMVATKEIRSAEPGNITWIGAVVNSSITNCLWPDSPPDDVVIDGEDYEGYNGTYLAVVKLVNNGDGTASAAPDFDQSKCGHAVSDFNAPEILAELQENASAGVEWVKGAEHPVFSWDEVNAYVEVSDVTLDMSEVDLTTGETLKIKVEVTPGDATNPSVTWMSSDPSVATVDANGVVTALKPGIVTITATADGVTAECVITVSAPVNIPDTYDIELIVSDGGSAKTNLTNASAGSIITVTATPENGYELAYITVDGERISGNSFKMPGHDVTVRVYFTNGGFPFADVAGNAWYYDAVSYVYANGLMDGTSGTMFEPDANMTRAMVWAILARVDGETVTGANWADTAREWAVTNGVSDGENANGYVTREQLATMLYRYAGEPETDGSGVGVFDDGETVSVWAFDAMSWALNNGVITGVSDDALLPANTATRAQCAAMLMRFVENI